MPHWTGGNRRAAADILPVVQANSLLQQGKLREAMELAEEAAKSAGDTERRFLARVFLFYVAEATGKLAEAKQHLDAALASSHPRSEIIPLLYYRATRIARMEKDLAGARRLARSAQTADAALVAPSGWGAAAARLVN
jgi:tetratricopeptide (TPR) repeat protein